MKIILGSKSQGRKKMMEEMGLEFEVISPDIDEKAIRFEDPQKLVLALARAKAEALKKRVNKPAILITSDQVVVCDGKIREKPENADEARYFLESYQKYPAETITSVVVTNLETGKSREAVDVAKIYLKPYTKEEVDELINDGKVFNFAGGFTINGEKWEHHIDKIEGTRDSIIGLPKEITKKLIDEVTK